VWLKGLDPGTLQRLADDPAAVAAISARLDALLMCALDPDAVAAGEAATPRAEDRLGSRGVEAALPAAISPSAGPLDWRQHVTPLPAAGAAAAGIGDGEGPGQSRGLRLTDTQLRQYITNLLVATNVHTHSATCRKTKRGGVQCRLSMPQACWDVGSCPVELVASVGASGVAALATMTPHSVANPAGRHNPVFPFPRPDARVLRWELWRPSAGVTPEAGQAALREYLLRNTAAATVARAAGAVVFPLPVDSSSSADAMGDSVGGLSGGTAGGGAAGTRDHGGGSVGPGAASDAAQDGGVATDAAAGSGAARPPAVFEGPVRGPNGSVVCASPMLTAWLRCNTAIMFLGNEDDARNSTMYIVKYVAKVGAARGPLQSCVLGGAPVALNCCYTPPRP
jgi:hypothetical protein